MKALFRWQPDGATLIAFLAGLVAVGLSLLMLVVPVWASVVARDVLQVFVVGILLPLLYIRRPEESFPAFGFTTRRWVLFLAINLGLGILLLLLFLRTAPPPAGFTWNAVATWKAAYVMLTVTFECVFFYAFLRTLFERAFGAVAGIVLAAAFYSFHHAGFQPEFAMLFGVGVLYATVFRLGNSALLIWPFFLGVGGVYDVLIKSRVVADIPYVEVRTVGLAVAYAAVALWLWHAQGNQTRPSVVSAK